MVMAPWHIVKIDKCQSLYGGPGMYKTLIYKLDLKSVSSMEVQSVNSSTGRGQWPVFVNDGIERQAISPAGCEVVDVDIGISAGARTKSHESLTSESTWHESSVATSV